jgi:hypothetical protein
MSRVLNDDDKDTFAVEADKAASSNTEGPHGRSFLEARSAPRSQRPASREGAPVASPHARRSSISQITMTFEPPEEHNGGLPLVDDWAAASALRTAFMAPRQPKPPPMQHVASFRQRGPPPVQRARLLRASTFGSSGAGAGTADQALLDSWRADLAMSDLGGAPALTPAALSAVCSSSAASAVSGPLALLGSLPPHDADTPSKTLRRYSMDYDTSRGSTTLLAPTVFGIAARRQSVWGSTGATRPAALTAGPPATGPAAAAAAVHRTVSRWRRPRRRRYRRRYR